MAPPSREELLRRRVHQYDGALTAGLFNEHLHPRGRDGRFINIGGLINWFVAGQKQSGKVTNITTGDGGKPVITAKDDSGAIHALEPEQVSEAVRIKARLGGDPMAKVRANSESNVDVEERKARLRERVHGNLAERELEAGKGPVMGPAAKGSGTKEDPYVTGDVNEAARLLGEGKYVQLQQPDQVATLLDKLKAIVDDARSKGEAAPNYNLCQVSVPDTNLFCTESKNIPRNHMPQLGGVPTPGTEAAKLPHRLDDKGNDTGEVDLTDAFLKFLADRGIKVTKETKPASHLRASQSQLNGAKVAGIADYMAQGNQILGAIFVSRDNYVIDGHHRWAADVGLQYKTGQEVQVETLTIDADILQVLAIADNFAASMGIPTNTVTDTRDNPVADEAARLVDRSGGATFRPNAKGTGVIQPTEGFVVAVPSQDNHPAIIDAATVKDRAKFKAELERWLIEAEAYRAKNPNYHFGFWADDTGTVYLDITEVLPDRAAAEQAGRERDQIAIWDLAAGTEIPTGGTGAIAEQPVAASGGTDDNSQSPTGQGVRDPRDLEDVTRGQGRVLGGADGRSHHAHRVFTGSTGGITITSTFPFHSTNTFTTATGVIMEPEPIVARAFSTRERKKAAGTGAAMPGGEYPINNVQDLKNAIQAYGRAKNPEAVKKHIISRAKSLGAVSELPEEWRKGMTASAEDLRARVHGVTAAGKFTEALHPRGHDGRFIEIGALVHFLIGADDHTGRVTGIADNGDGTTAVSVDEDGKTLKLKPNQILSSSPAKASLPETWESRRDNPQLPFEGDRLKARAGDHITFDDGTGITRTGVVESFDMNQATNAPVFHVRPTDPIGGDLVDVQDADLLSRDDQSYAYGMEPTLPLDMYPGQDVGVPRAVREAIDEYRSIGESGEPLTPEQQARIEELRSIITNTDWQRQDLPPPPPPPYVPDLPPPPLPPPPIPPMPDFGKGYDKALRQPGDEEVWAGVYQMLSAIPPEDLAKIPRKKLIAALSDRDQVKAFQSLKDFLPFVSITSQVTKLSNFKKTHGGDSAGRYKMKITAMVDHAMNMLAGEPLQNKIYAGQPASSLPPPPMSASALLAGGSVVKAESPFLSADGTSWNGEILPDTVKAALVAPMSKVSSPGAAEALNALYQSLVLNSGGGGTPLESIIQQVTELDRVAEADGTDGGDASALQKASKLIRTLFAIPDQSDLDRAQERANNKAKGMKPGSKKKAEGEPDAAAEAAEPTPDAETPADAASEAPAAAPAAAPAEGGGDAAAEALRKRVHV